VKGDLLLKAPTAAASPPRTTRREMQTLDPEQVRILFESTATHRLSALWVLLVTTGMRSGEAAALTWADIGATSINIQHSVQRQRGRGIFTGDAKTEGSRRHIELAPEARAALQHHHDRQVLERRKAMDLWTDQDLVFCTETGELLDPSAIHKALTRCLKAAGLPAIRVHDLRHTCATLLLGKGVHPKMVQELLGHSSIMLTLNTYSHVMPSMHAEVASYMSELFTGS
jgi:integrase